MSLAKWSDKEIEAERLNCCPLSEVGQLVSDQTGDIADLAYTSSYPYTSVVWPYSSIVYRF